MEHLTISIQGQTYTMPMTPDINPLLVQAAAKVVEEKLDAVKTNTTEVSTSKIMMYACLEIALDFLNLKTEHEKLSSKVNRKADELIAEIDAVLS
jgi:cell division protein ZapA (FtsZ GTPase activity inhibitor)